MNSISNFEQTLSRDAKNTKLRNKVYWSTWAALLFVIVSLPSVYNLTNSSGLDTTSGPCPTSVGKLLHTLVFFLLLFLLMKYFTLKKSGKTDGLMAKYAFYSALIFFLLSSPEVYSVTRSLYSGIADSNGCPTLVGIMVHGLVFIAVLTAVMYFPNDNDRTMSHHMSAPATEEMMMEDREDVRMA
jgi:hypothetical protein